MATIAAVTNPIQGNEVLVFTVTDLQNLSIEHRPLADAGPVLFVDNNPPNLKGPIIQPGGIAAIVHQKTVSRHEERVGVVVPNDDRATGGCVRPHFISQPRQRDQNHRDSVAVEPRDQPDIEFQRCHGLSQVGASGDELLSTDSLYG